MDNCVFTINSEITTRMVGRLTDVNGSLAMFGGRDFTFRINSLGGDAMAGLRIHAYPSRYPCKIRVEIGAIAAGVASLVAMVGSEIVMHRNSILHIMAPRMAVDGTAKEHLETAEQLDLMSDKIAGIFAQRTGNDQDEIIRMMSRQAFMDADEALAAGFCTEVSESPASFEKPKDIMDGMLPWDGARTYVPTWSRARPRHQPKPELPTDLLTCPECKAASPRSEWTETEVGCEDCGDHSALRCPKCEEAIDLVYNDLEPKGDQ